MINDMLSAAKDAVTERMSSNEAAVVKAKIIIVKGGNFANASSEDTNPFGDLLGGVEIPEDLMSEFHQVSQELGLTENGTFQGYSDGEEIKVQLNPNSYQIRSVSNFKSEKMGGIKEANGTFGVFAPPKPRELSVILFYDSMLQADYLKKIQDATTGLTQSLQSVTSLVGAATTAMNVFQRFNAKEDLNKLYLEKLLGLTHILKGINTPPLISFQYGSTVFEGYAKEVSIEYKRFNKQGEVVQAQVSLKMEESNIFAQKQQTSSLGEDSVDLSSESNVLETESLPI